MKVLQWQHSDHLFDPSLTFDTIGWIKEISGLPILVKGILRPDDAQKAISSGADGIIISNHGGRQLDTAVPTLKQIEPIRNQVEQRGNFNCRWWH